MGIKKYLTIATDYIKKYKIPMIILLFGILLLTIPNMIENDESRKEYTENTSESTCSSVCQEIEKILSCVDGVGKTRVMLTVEAGEKNVYQTDNRTSNADGNTSTQNDVIIITDAERTQNGLVTQVISETYKGAIIVCEGADSAAVRLSVVDAVSKITGLNSNQITVMKMK